MGLRVEGNDGPGVQIIGEDSRGIEYREVCPFCHYQGRTLYTSPMQGRMSQPVPYHCSSCNKYVDARIVSE